MGRVEGLSLAGISGVQAGIGCIFLKKYFSTVESVKDAIIYKAPEINQTVIENADKVAYRLADFGDFALGAFFIGVASATAGLALYELRK
jgi:hypothetical protein